MPQPEPSDSHEVYAVEWNGECYQSVFPEDEAGKSALHSSIEDAKRHIQNVSLVRMEDIHVTPYYASATVIPITQEYPSMNLNTDDANSVSRFFQSLADKVVLASTLPKEVEDLRAAVDQLKKDVEAYREHNARMDEEISNLRRERQQLQDENAQLRNQLSVSENDHNMAQTRWSQACSERDRWHNDYIALSTTHEDMKRTKDDADMRIMELEESLSRVSNERDNAQRERDSVHDRLTSIRNALAA